MARLRSARGSNRCSTGSWTPRSTRSRAPLAPRGSRSRRYSRTRWSRFPDSGFECCQLSHPGGALGYRITPNGGGPALAYLTDNELGAGGAARVTSPRGGPSSFDSSGARRCSIHDGMYTPVLAEERSGWGHSSALDAVALAREAGVDQLALFHHDPDHDDAQVDGLLAMARAAAPPG